MTDQSNRPVSALALFSVAIIAGGAGYLLASGEHASGSEFTQDAHSEPTPAGDGPCAGGAAPLYWVAPMDSAFRRDAPGKSPMGMDLVPECADPSGSAADVSTSPAVTQSLGVRTAKVQHRTFTPTVRAVGTVAVNGDTIQTVHTRSEGWLRTVGAGGVGESIAAGDAFYTLFAPKLQAAEQDYLSAGNNRALRSAAAARLQTLGYSPAQVRAVARRGQAAETISTTAQSDATVIALNARPGQYVLPSTPIMTLADLSTVWIDVLIPERDAARVTAGQAATVAVEAYPGDTWSATVALVHPMLDATTRSVRVRLLVDNADGRLAPDMFAAAVIHSAEFEGLSVPANAVIRTGGQSEYATRAIMQQAEGQFDVVPVELGDRVDDQFLIKTGLSEGDTVVVAGQFLIDSEANVAAESGRMSHDHNAGQASAPRGRATGKVLSVEGEQIMLDHGPFEAQGEQGLSMPAMTMGFVLDSSVSLSGISLGDSVTVVVENPARGVYRVVEIAPVHVPEMDRGTHQHHDAHAGMTHGVVSVVNAETGLLVLDHQRIETLNMGAMTMGFAVAPDVDLSGLKHGDRVMFSAHRAASGPNAGKFEVTAIHVMSGSQDQSAPDMLDMPEMHHDHSGH